MIRADDMLTMRSLKLKKKKLPRSSVGSLLIITKVFYNSIFGVISKSVYSHYNVLYDIKSFIPLFGVHFYCRTDNHGGESHFKLCTKYYDQQFVVTFI